MHTDMVLILAVGDGLIALMSIPLLMVMAVLAVLAVLVVLVVLMHHYCTKKPLGKIFLR